MGDNKMNNRPNFVVCLKNVPLTLQKQDLEKMCTRFGSIEHINMNKQPFVFVKVSSQNDLENVIGGLKHNNYGIIAETAKCSAQPTPRLGAGGENQDHDRSQRFKQNMTHKRNEDDRRVNNSDHRPMNKIEDCIDGNSDTMNAKTAERFLCKLCKKSSQNVCERCGDFYCSLKCQHADWEKHRYICFPIPRLVAYSSSKFDAVPEEQPHVPQLNRELPDGRSQTSKHKQNSIAPKETASLPVNNKPTSQITGKTQNAISTPNSIKDEKLEKSCTPRMPPNGTKVVLTSVKTSNQVFIRSLDKVDDENYMNILCQINAEGKSARKLSKSPNVGDIVITDFMKTGHYRAAVTKVENQNIEVFYIDFGNKEQKQLEDLREIPANLLNTPQYICEVTLKNVPSFPLTEKARAFVDKYVDNLIELKLIHGSHPEENRFELFDIVDNVKFNDKIMEFKSHVENVDSRQIAVTINDIKVNLLPAGENVPVFISDNSLAETNMISCISQSYLGLLDALNEELNVYAENIKETHTPRESEVVLALFEDDQKWYRAECLEYEGKEHVSVMFIDFGNFATVNVKNIKKYPHQLLRPCYTSSCIVSGLPDELSEKAANKLRELVPSNAVAVIDKVEADETNVVNIIHLPRVVAALKEENLF